MKIKKQIVKVDLGSGFQDPIYKKQWVTVDKNPDSMAQIITDIDCGLPFKSDSIDIIQLSSVLIYIKNKVQLGQEVNRVLKSKGIVILHSHYMVQSPHIIVNIGSFIKASGLIILKSNITDPWSEDLNFKGYYNTGYISYTLQKP
jgi:SAM-dependent methyltransferase